MAVLVPRRQLELLDVTYRRYYLDIVFGDLNCNCVVPQHDKILDPDWLVSQASNLNSVLSVAEAFVNGAQKEVLQTSVRAVVQTLQH